MENKKVKICWVANNDVAVKFLLLSQLKFLIKEGYDVHVACSSGKWIDEVEKEGIKVKVIKIKRNISPFYDLITLYRIWNYFKKEKFDIVHTNNPKPGLLGQLAAKMAGVPIVINTIHGLYFQDNSSINKRKFFIFIEKIAAKCSDLIFSVNREDIETMIRERIVNSEKIRYLGNGINIYKFNPEKFSREFIDKKRKQLDIPSDFKVLGIVARLVREKGYLDLFGAFKEILKIFPKTILLVVGAEEPEKRDAVSPGIVKNYGIEKNVIFLGERSDVDEIYSLMDVFVLPSYREGLPVSLLEAMAEKRPVVATDIRGCREEMESGKSGILVPVKNINKLAEAIISLLGDKSLADGLGNRARLRVEKYFDEAFVFDRIKEEYDGLIKEKISAIKKKRAQRFIKRTFDLFLALFLLILFSPIFLIIAVLIKSDSRGPVFYQGERVGRFGKVFKMMKFRTMVPNAEKIGTIHASRNDPRITKVGRFLRTYKLDELPQFINILKGEMSFVGPRPQVKHYVDLYNEEEKISLSVRPGMTDYATIQYINQEDLMDEGNVDESYREKIEPLKNRLRVKYAKNNSLFIDAKIVLQTFLAIFKKIVLKKR